MNYLAHALPFLDEPYLAAGTAVPDWLTVADRGARVRPKNVRPLVEADERATALVARGTMQHFGDDAHFHETRAFAETMLAMTALVRGRLGTESGFRPGFLGHLLVEVLLDAVLAAEDPGRMDAYYAALEAVDPPRVQEAVNRAALRPTERLTPMIELFRRERILYDYLEDAKLMVRLNQVMRRVGFPTLPDGFADVLSAARQLAADRRQELLDGIPVTPPVP